MSTETLDRPPAGWFVLDVMTVDDIQKSDWCALMIDVPPDEFLNHRRNPQQPSVLVRIPGQHRDRDAAWDCLEGLMATRH